MLDHFSRLAFVSVFALIAAGPALAADQPAAAESPVARLHKVDDRLYRGGQPDEAGFRHLRDLGIKTIVNLRLEADAERTNERQIVESLGMRYVNVPIRDGNFFTWFRRIPEDSIKAFFKTLDTEAAPVFVHCRRGTDRTGAFVAFYRIARNGWDIARALKEAEDRGMRAWYRGLRAQIRGFDPSTLQAAPTGGQQ